MVCVSSYSSSYNYMLLLQGRGNVEIKLLDNENGMYSTNDVIQGRVIVNPKLSKIATRKHLHHHVFLYAP